MLESAGKIAPPSTNSRMIGAVDVHVVGQVDAAEQRHSFRAELAGDVPVVGPVAGSLDSTESMVDGTGLRVEDLDGDHGGQHSPSPRAHLNRPFLGTELPPHTPEEPERCQIDAPDADRPTPALKTLTPTVPTGRSIAQPTPPPASSSSRSRARWRASSPSMWRGILPVMLRCRQWRTGR